LLEVVVAQPVTQTWPVVLEQVELYTMLPIQLFPLLSTTLQWVVGVQAQVQLEQTVMIQYSM
jgi:hypothetical protein